MKKRFLTTVGWMLSTLIIASCGGGGSNNNNNASNEIAPGTSTSTTVSLAGVAAKGLISGATVEAFEIVNGIEKSLGKTATTDGDGRYSLEGLPKTTNPVVIKLTTNSNTKFLDETKPLVNGKFAEADKPMPVGTNIRSYVASLETANPSVAISPLTEMAVAAAAQSTEGLTPLTLASGKAQVKALLGGVDPVTTQAINANETADASQKTVMLYLTAIAQAANEKKGTQGCLDPSGVTCAMADLKTKAKLVKDGSGHYKADKPDELVTLLNTKIDSAKSAMGNHAFLEQLNTARAPTKEDGFSLAPVDPNKAIEAESFQAFIDGLRFVPNKAMKDIDDRIAVATQANTVFHNTSTNVDFLDDLNRLCTFPASNSGSMTCTDGKNKFNQPVTFTKQVDGSYQFNYQLLNTHEPVTPGTYRWTGTYKAHRPAVGQAAFELSATKTYLPSGQSSAQTVETVSLTAEGIRNQSSDITIIQIKNLDNKTYSREYNSQSNTSTYSTNKWKQLTSALVTIEVQNSSALAFSGSFTESNNTGQQLTLNVSKLTAEQSGGTLRPLIANLSIEATDAKGLLAKANLTFSADYSSTTNYLEASNGNESANNFIKGSIGFELNGANATKGSVNLSRTAFDQVSLTAVVIPDLKNPSNTVTVQASGRQIAGSWNLSQAENISITSGNGVYQASYNPNTKTGIIKKGSTQIGVIADGKMYIGNDSGSGMVISLN